MKNNKPLSPEVTIRHIFGEPPFNKQPHMKKVRDRIDPKEKGYHYFHGLQFPIAYQDENGTLAEDNELQHLAYEIWNTLKNVEKRHLHSISYEVPSADQMVGKTLNGFGFASNFMIETFGVRGQCIHLDAKKFKTGIKILKKIYEEIKTGKSDFQIFLDVGHSSARKIISVKHKLVVDLSDVTFGFYAHHYDDLDKFSQTIFEYIQKERISDYNADSGMKINLLEYDTSCGVFYLEPINIEYKPDESLSFEDLYGEEFEEQVFDKLKNWLADSNVTANIAFLHGTYGTGKTHFLRRLIHESPSDDIVLIPSYMMERLVDPSFATYIQEQRNKIFIIEDAEKIILNREEHGSSPIISSIINMTDGIMGDIMKFKFICTFNCGMERIDKALLRKGRCHLCYEFRKLGKDETNSLCEKIGVEKLDREATLAEIFNPDENIDNLENEQVVGFQV